MSRCPGQGLPCVPRLFAQQQASLHWVSQELGGTVETTSSGSAPQGGQAGQRDPADRVISSPPAPVFSYWCRGCTSFLWERQQLWCTGRQDSSGRH